MMPSSEYKKQIAQKISFSIMTGTTIWILLVMHYAGSLGSIQNGDVVVAIGPFILNNLSKRPLHGGFTAHITFESGLIWYSLLWVLGGLLIGVLLAHRHKNHNNQ